MTWTKKQTILAKKTIHASTVRRQGKEMKKLIDIERRKHARAVHMRKETVRLHELGLDAGKASGVSIGTKKVRCSETRIADAYIRDVSAANS